jgi:hypothetical protein
MTVIKPLKQQSLKKIPSVKEKLIGFVKDNLGSSYWNNLDVEEFTTSTELPFQGNVKFVTIDFCGSRKKL